MENNGVKYCVNCGTACPEKNKFCGECGKNEFASTYEQSLRIKTERELRAKLEAEYEQKLKAELAAHGISESVNDKQPGGDSKQTEQPAKPKMKITYVRSDESNAPLFKKSGEYILFGSYPQEKIVNTLKRDELMEKAGGLPTPQNPGNWTSYKYFVEGKRLDYMWYIDIGDCRGVYFKLYRPEYYKNPTVPGVYSPLGNNGYDADTVYWFQREPIKWRVLERSGNKALLICDSIIDEMDYNAGGVRAVVKGKELSLNNYAHSAIRKWLNSTFVSTAFTERERAIILDTTVDNSSESTMCDDNENACENTVDKVFLPSYAEMDDIDYDERIRKTTDYAQAQGAYDGESSWMLRSPGDADDDEVFYVDTDGYIDFDDDRMSAGDVCGVVPALWIKM